MFKGLDKMDGAELYDTMDEAIARAKMIIHGKTRYYNYGT